MYDVICRTNLDDYKRQNWPRRLPALPRKGDQIQAESGRKLCVVGVTFLYDGKIEVELHRRWEVL